MSLCLRAGDYLFHFSSLMVRNDSWKLSRGYPCGDAGWFSCRVSDEFPQVGRLDFFCGHRFCGFCAFDA